MFANVTNIFQSPFKFLYGAVPKFQFAEFIQPNLIF